MQPQLGRELMGAKVADAHRRAKQAAVVKQAVSARRVEPRRSISGIIPWRLVARGRAIGRAGAVGKARTRPATTEC